RGLNLIFEEYQSTIHIKSMDIKTKKQALRKLGKPYFKLFLASSPLHFKVRDKRFNGPFYLAIG
ncbi:hypothetical protein, partial [Streptococcus pneumoniae]|uniref:hypothetical protein n=1 Tax=Streptococcus pneumoniae TaxID=1313 RepID=UPI001C5C9D32